VSRVRGNRSVGFDRKVRLEWLDAAADGAGQGRTPGKVREELKGLLEQEVRGDKARENTVSVLMRIWVAVPDRLQSLRNDGLTLIQDRTDRERVVLHWGMCMASYPFFRGVASAMGKLAGVQGTVSLAQITRRVAERWGERSTVIRAVQRVTRSLVLWRVLMEEEEPGVFTTRPKIDVVRGDPLGAWMAEAALSNCTQSTRPLRGLLTDPAIFPFSLDPPVGEIEARPHLEVYRQGLDEELVALTTG